MATAPAQQPDDIETRIAKIRSDIARLNSLPPMLRNQLAQNIETELNSFRFSRPKDFLSIRNELLQNIETQPTQDKQPEVVENEDGGGGEDEAEEPKGKEVSVSEMIDKRKSEDEDEKPAKKILMTDRRVQKKAEQEAADKAAQANTPQAIRRREDALRKQQEEQRRAKLAGLNTEAYKKMRQAVGVSTTIDAELRTLDKEKERITNELMPQKAEAEGIIAKNKNDIDEINRMLLKMPKSDLEGRRNLVSMKTALIKSKMANQDKIKAIDEQAQKNENRRAQLAQRRSVAEQAQRQSATDAEYIRTMAELKRREKNLTNIPVQLNQIRDDKYALQILTREYGDPDKVKALKPEQLRAELQRVRRQYVEKNILSEAQLANEAQMKLNELEARGVSAAVPKERPDLVSDDRTRLFRESVDELRDDKTWSRLVDKREVNRILKSQDPLEMLGFGKGETVSPEKIDKRYRELALKLFVNSSDPKAQRAFETLQSTAGQYVNQIVRQQVTPEKLREQSKSQADDSRAMRAENMRNISKYSRNSYDSGTRVSPVKSAKAWLRKQAEYDKQMRRETVGKGLFLLDRTINKGTSKVGSGIDRVTGRRISKLTGRIAKSSFWDREIVKWDKYNPEVGGVQELHKQRYTIREKYREKRKKGSVRNVFALGKLIYDLTIGKRIAWVREMVANVKDMIKEVQGIKQIISGVNKIKRTYGAATTRINTAVWNGRIGKTIIAIKRVGNAVEALKRASFSGLQAGLITGGVALAAGASAPATLALMGTAAGTSFGVKVVADTLNSTRTHFWAPIANLQKKYGVVKYGNVAPYGVKGGLIGPEAPRVNISRLRTFTNSFNWAFYGAGIGAALATVGIVSMPAGIIGGTMLGVGSRYVAGRATNRVGQFLFNKYGYNINKYSGFRMPIFSIVDTSLMPVWLKSQYAEIQQMGLWDYIYARYLNSGQLNWNILRSGFNWLNLGFKGVSTYTTASWMASLGAGSTVTSAFSGALLGGITGALLASTLIPGVALGTGALVGATVGAIIGGAIGTYLIPVPFVGTYVGSTVGSFFGAIIGDWFDDKARKAYEDAMKKIKELEAMAKALENLLGSLSLFKGLLDFLNDLDKKFDPAMALGLTLTLTAGMSILVDAGLDVTPSKTDTGSSGSSSSASQKPGGNVAGAQDTKTKPKEYDCLSQKNRKIINPKTSLITRIRVKSGFYEIYTDEFVFRNIKTPNKNLEVDGTLSAGDLVGYCK